MMDLRGIVVEAKKDSVIVLTPDADIVEVETHGQEFEIGQEILFYAKEQEKLSRKRLFLYMSAVAASVLFLLVIPSSLIEEPVDKPPVPPPPVTTSETHHTEGNTENRVAMKADKPVEVREEMKKPVHVNAQTEVPETQTEVQASEQEPVRHSERKLPMIRYPEKASVRHIEKAPNRKIDQQPVQPVRHHEKPIMRQPENVPIRRPEKAPIRRPERAPVTAPVTITANHSEIGVQIGLLNLVEATLQVADENGQGENGNAQ